jgi:hypothetical protein
MKRITLILFAFLFLYPITTYSQSSFDGCAPEGRRKSGAVPPAKEAAMNRMKNRDEITGNIDHSITIQSLIAAKEETDLDLNRPVEIIGFVADVIDGTPNETCNCAQGVTLPISTLTLWLSRQTGTKRSSM